MPCVWNRCVAIPDLPGDVGRSCRVDGQVCETVGGDTGRAMGYGNECVEEYPEVICHSLWLDAER